jgi:hypothetical protein
MLLHDDGCQPFQGFVGQQECGVEHQRPANWPVAPD